MGIGHNNSKKRNEKKQKYNDDMSFYLCIRSLIETFVTCRCVAACATAVANLAVVADPRHTMPRQPFADNRNKLRIVFRFVVEVTSPDHHRTIILSIVIFSVLFSNLIRSYSVLIKYILLINSYKYTEDPRTIRQRQQRKRSGNVLLPVIDILTKKIGCISISKSRSD